MMGIPAWLYKAIFLFEDDSWPQPPVVPPICAGDVEPRVFALTVLGSGRNANDGVADIVQQIFVPMSREFREIAVNGTSQVVS
jgi:hypothetical protein